MSNDRTERKLINSFVDGKYSSHFPGYTVTGYPEDSASGEIDALAQCKGAPNLAIEHTLIETFRGQQEDNFRFMKVFGSLENELRDLITGLGYISVTVSVGAVTSKLDKARDQVRSLLIENLAMFPNGTRRYQVGKPAFEVTVSRRPSARGKDFLSFQRWAPADADITVNLLKAYEQKQGKLRKHHDAGEVALLLIETRDIALVSHLDFWKAFVQTRSQLPAGIDQVWLAETYDPDDSANFLCFYGDPELMREANPENFLIHPDYYGYWEKVIAEETGEQKHQR